MRILGIETSCDETSAAIVEGGTLVRSCIISSSRQVFLNAGGVIPEQAARKQVECMLPVIEQAMEGIVSSPKEIDAIAVTRGPGLMGSLLVGTTTARVLAKTWGIPIVGVHHTLGHLSSTWIHKPDAAPATQPEFPILTLSASGGHTELWLRKSHVRGKLLGRTRDDAAGEAFDKGAILLGLPYPGGPAISEKGASGDSTAIPFPSPLSKEKTFDFSFSGLKTSLRYSIRDMGEEEARKRIADVAASYEAALCRHLITRIKRAVEVHPEIREVHVVGGVSANKRLRALLTEEMPGRTVRFPLTLSYCTDNAAMIAAAGEFLIQELGDAAYEDFVTVASLPLEQAVK